MQGLRGHLTGFGVPTYVLDTPYGKVPLAPQYLLGRAGDEVVVRTWDGHLWREPNPLDTQHAAISLPVLNRAALSEAADPRHPFRAAGPAMAAAATG